MTNPFLPPPLPLSPTRCLDLYPPKESPAACYFFRLAFFPTCSPATPPTGTEVRKSNPISPTPLSSSSLACVLEFVEFVGPVKMAPFFSLLTSSFSSLSARFFQAFFPYCWRRGFFFCSRFFFFIKYLFRFFFFPMSPLAFSMDFSGTVSGTYRVFFTLLPRFFSKSWSPAI